MGDETPKSNECSFFSLSRVTPKYTQLATTTPFTQTYGVCHLYLNPTFSFHVNISCGFSLSRRRPQLSPSFLPFPCSSHSFTIQQLTKVDDHTSPSALCFLVTHISGFPSTDQMHGDQKVRVSKKRVAIEGRGYGGCMYRRKSASRKGYVRWFKDSVVMEWGWTFTGDCSLKDKDQGLNS